MHSSSPLHVHIVNPMVWHRGTHSVMGSEPGTSRQIPLLHSVPLAAGSGVAGQVKSTPSQLVPAVQRGLMRGLERHLTEVLAAVQFRQHNELISLHWAFSLNMHVSAVQHWPPSSPSSHSSPSDTCRSPHTELGELKQVPLFEYTTPMLRRLQLENTIWERALPS